MAELRVKAGRLALVLIVITAAVNWFWPWKAVGWGWILGLAASMVSNLLLHNWVKIVTNAGTKKTLAAVSQGYGVRTAISLGVLAVAYVYPDSFNLIATGLGVMTFPYLIYLTATWYGRKES